MFDITRRHQYCTIVLKPVTCKFNNTHDEKLVYEFKAVFIHSLVNIHAMIKQHLMKARLGPSIP